MERRAPEPLLPFAPLGTAEAADAGTRPSDGERVVLSVAEFDRAIKRMVEDAGEIDVEGEISGLKLVASGHAYFTLKDEREDASVDCVMYRTAAPRARRLLVEGARVVVVGHASLYVPRGRLQFTVEDARPAGRGALLEAFERLKRKLYEEGLFAPERKRKLPTEPRVVGVVTSADGAALHDIVKVAWRRAAVRLLLARAPVQGADAPERLSRALLAVARVPEVDVIILGRGGGSRDDLAAFNDERLARAVAMCPVPIVSAVGHEVDITLVDLVADARAATPSQAAELVVHDAEARALSLEHLAKRLDRSMIEILGHRRQRVDDARAALAGSAARLFVDRRAAVAKLERRLLARHPSAVLAAARAAFGPAELRLESTMKRGLAARRARLQDLAGRLDAMSPLAVLSRGYAIATGPTGAPILDARELTAGDVVRVRLHRGAIEAVATRIDPGAPREGERDPRRES